MSRDAMRGRSSIEQSVSERGNTPIAAQASRRDAETRENQVQETTTDSTARAADKYVSWLFFI